MGLGRRQVYSRQFLVAQNPVALHSVQIAAVHCLAVVAKSKSTMQ